jgi:hypothetical protein
MKVEKIPTEDGLLVCVSEGEFFYDMFVEDDDVARYDAEPWKWSELVNKMHRMALEQAKLSPWACF